MTPTPIPPDQRDRLRALSAKLLGLHKLLLDAQRASYEHEHGPVGSTGQFLGLVLEHPEFAWLRQLSGLIVEIDEITATRSKAGTEEASAALDRAQLLLIPAESGTDFQTHYSQAMDKSPEIRAAHEEIISQWERTN